MSFRLTIIKLIIAPTLSLLMCQCAQLERSAYYDLGTAAPTVRSADFKSNLATVAKATWHDGSHVTTLPNGDAFFPEMRKAGSGTLIAAAGTSCRHQIKDGTGRNALHPIEILHASLNSKGAQIFLK